MVNINKPSISQANQDENGLWWVYNFGTVLGGFGSFEVQEQAERVIKLFDKTKVGNLDEAH